jgi:hypothetical protein
VKTHRGHIEATSETGKGTTFLIFIPVSQEREDTASEKWEIVRMRKLCRVLLVDDEDGARDATKRLLEHYAITVTD